ncbi:MAG: ergothioneine biosynthesis protein EgtB [Planctomycetota bacterium]
MVRDHGSTTRGEAEADAPARTAPAALGARGSEGLARRFVRTRARTLALAAPLSPEDRQAQSMPEASPAKWHLGHTTWFFERFVLAPRGVRVRPEWDELLNSYYVTIGARHPRPERGLLTRPSNAEIERYRADVEAEVVRALPELDDAGRALVELGCRHEEQHQELLLMDALHLLSRNPLRPAYAAPTEPTTASTPAPPALRLTIPSGVHEIGAPDDGAFHFDNERPRHRVHLAGGAIASRPVTNGEWLAFVEDGGYRRAELWMSDGVDAVVREGFEAPLYWERRDDGTRRTFGLTGMRDLALDEPVQHVSWYEADAFARWSGARLPREGEWEVAMLAHFDGAFAALATDDEDAYLSVRTLPRRCTEEIRGPGDSWEWTLGGYEPYPGYAPPPGAVGEYNGKFMSGQLVLRGGSFATPHGHASATYRNFFWHTARWPFTGVRLAWDA